MKNKLSGLNISSDELDSLVHQFKSQEATNINNQGVKAQLNYLRNECELTDDEILTNLENNV